MTSPRKRLILGLAVARQENPLIGIAEALRILSTSEQVGYILDSSLNLVSHNKAWDKFARENSAPELADGAANGTNLLSVTHESLRAFYSAAFHRVTQEKTLWQWEYECSSAELFRKFLMRVYPITPSGWFLVTNRVLIESEHPSGKTDLDGYTDDQGQIRMCPHCRCSKRVAPPERWDFVRANLKPQMANVRYDLCPICRQVFYRGSELKRESTQTPKPDDCR